MTEHNGRIDRGEWQIGHVLFNFRAKSDHRDEEQLFFTISAARFYLWLCDEIKRGADMRRGAVEVA